MGRKDKATIGLVLDGDNCVDAAGNPVPFYTFNPEDYGGSVVRRDANEATLEELVQLCDHDAENVNAHEYCSAHRLLAAVLFLHLGREVATTVMRDIANRRGLHGMTGMCGLRDSFADLGVGNCGRDWDGTFEKD